MLSNKQLEEVMGLILLIGVLLSIALVLVGATIYLYQNGAMSIHSSLLPSDHYNTNIRTIFHSAMTFSPIGIIELGLLSFVSTQILRVGLLVWYYCATKDYWFILFSSFILFTLIYSIIWRT